MARRPAAPPDLSKLSDEQRQRRLDVIRFGELAFGDGWKSEIARILDRAEEQVHAWVQGRRAVPVDIPQELACVQIELAIQLQHRGRQLQYWPALPPDVPSEPMEARRGPPLTIEEILAEVIDPDEPEQEASTDAAVRRRTDWRHKRVTPWSLPWGENGAYDPELVVEVQPIDDAAQLVADPIWAAAPLTQMAREEIPNWLGEAQRVRLPLGEPSAIVLKLRANFSAGRAFSTAPEKARLRDRDRLLVVLSDRVIAVEGRLVDRAYAHLANVFVGTHRRHLAPSRR